MSRFSDGPPTPPALVAGIGEENIVYNAEDRLNVKERQKVVQPKKIEHCERIAYVRLLYDSDAWAAVVS